MKKQDTAAFSLIRCDTEKKMPALAVRAIRAALFFAGLLAVAQGAAGIWTNYGWVSGAATGAVPPQALRRWSGRAWRLDFRAAGSALCFRCSA